MQETKKKILKVHKTPESFVVLKDEILDLSKIFQLRSQSLV